MENTVKQTEVLEKTGVYDEDLKRRFELSLTYKGRKGKKLLVIGIQPASSSVFVIDNSTNFLLNNLGEEYPHIVVWNLFANICLKLKPSEIEDNTENINYLNELLKQKFDAILVSYGNSFLGNRKVEEAKKQVHEKLKPFAEKVFELTDKQNTYTDLRATHILFAGQRYSGNWQLRPFEFPKENKE